MIVSAAKLKKFINKCIVYSRGMTDKRTPYLLDLKLSGEKNTLIVPGVDKNNNILVDFRLSVECEESFSFYIKDSLDFLKFLKDNKFKGKIELTQEGIISNGELIEYPLGECIIHSWNNYFTYIDNVIIKDTKFNYSNAVLSTSIIAKSKDIADAVKKVNYRYELFEYRFEVMDNRFFVSILSRDNKKFKTEIPAVVTGDDCCSIYSIGVDCLFKELGNEVILHLNSNTPMIVEDAGDRVIFFPVEYLDGDDK